MALSLWAQVNTPNTLQFPFPQNVIFNYGYKPANANSSDALAAYNAWKSEYVVSSGCQSGSLRVKFDASSNSNHTVSEGIAYGMLLSAYAGDKATFDGLYAYYVKFSNARGVMHWKVDNNSCGIVGNNGASDAECDVAMALYVANWQWGNAGTINYLQKCKDLINIIQQYEMTSSDKTMRPGDDPNWTEAGTTLVNISYFCPAYFRAFATIDNTDAAFWTAAADRCYTILNNTLNATLGNASNGLVPDWSNPAGTVPGGGNLSGYQFNGQRFYYDAARTPWRIALDYLWYGTASAQTYCNKTTAFVQGLGGSSNLKDGYYTNGSVFGTSHNNTFVGCFAIGSMASNNANVQTHLNSSYTDNVNTSPYPGQYFNSTLKALSLFTLTGNFYLPPPGNCTSPNLGADVSLCSGSPQVLNSGLSASGRTFSWTLNGATIGGATSPSYSATAAGIYEVTSNENGCIRKDQIEVFPVNPTANFTFVVTAQQVTFNNTSSGGDISWTWDIDGNASTDYTTESPIHNYSTAGLYNVTLVAKNTCNNTSTVTKQITIGSPTSAGGWVENKFTNWQTSSVWSANATTMAITTTCSEFVATCTAPGQYDPFGVTFKTTGGVDAPQDLSGYPYVRLKIKSSVAKQLRVDLGDNTTNCSGNPCSTSQTPTYINLTANPGQYQIVTLDFTGKFKDYLNRNVDATKIKQIAFTPSDNGSFTGVITVDWIIAGYANLPLPTVSSWSTSKTVCQGATTTLDATDCNADAYLWSTGETTASVTKGVGTYSVQVSNFGGTVTKTVTVTETLNPSAGFAATRNGLAVTFTDGSSNATSRSWNFGDAGTSSTTNPSHTYTAAGTYNVCLTATNSCGNNQSCASVTVCAITSPSFTNSAGSSATVNFTNTSTGGAPTSYSWDFGDGETGTGASPSHTFAADGTYPVTLTVSNSCNDSYSVTNDVVINTATPILDGQGNLLFNIYPNPGNGELTVESKSNSEYSISDLTGKELAHGTLKEGSNFISLKNKGMYLMKISNGDKGNIVKIEVQ